MSRNPGYANAHRGKVRKASQVPAALGLTFAAAKPLPAPVIEQVASLLDSRPQPGYA
jgi:hypothetical protein